MINALFLINRQGKVRLAKWYAYNPPVSERQAIIKQLINTVLTRGPKACSFVEWREQKVIYKRYASLYFIFVVDRRENELLVLELIQFFVEALDRYFNNVCELDLIFNFHKVYYLLDELLLGGYLQESSKKALLSAVAAQEELIEEGGRAK